MSDVFLLLCNAMLDRDEQFDGTTSEPAKKSSDTLFFVVLIALGLGLPVAAVFCSR